MHESVQDGLQGRPNIWNKKKKMMQNDRMFWNLLQGFTLMSEVDIQQMSAKSQKRFIES